MRLTEGHCRYIRPVVSRNRSMCMGMSRCAVYLRADALDWHFSPAALPSGASLRRLAARAGGIAPPCLRIEKGNYGNWETRVQGAGKKRAWVRWLSQRDEDPSQLIITTPGCGALFINFSA